MAFVALVIGLVFTLPSVRQLRQSILSGPNRHLLARPTKEVATVSPSSAVVHTVLETEDSMAAINDVAEGCGIHPVELQIRRLSPRCVHLTVAPNLAAAFETFARMVSLRAEVREAASVSRGPDSVPSEAVIFVRGEQAEHLRGAHTLMKLQERFETQHRFG